MRLGLLIGLAAAAAPMLAYSAEHASPLVARSYARHLIDVAMARHPAVTGMTLSARLPGAKQPVVVASTRGRLGAPAPAARGGTTVLAPLRDVEDQTIGTMAVSYRPGIDARARAADAAQVAAEIGKRIAHAGNLTDPWPYDPAFDDKTVAQALVDRTLQRHPEVLILAVHATPPGSQTNVIAGSNIGRLGKKADEDDLRVIDTGATNREVNDTGRRFEAELPLNDARGQRIGALGVVFRYRAGDDKDALVRRAEQIRDEMAREIDSPATLFRPGAQAASASGARLPVLASGHTDLPGYEGDFDHFAVAEPENRLFLAGEDGGTLEVFNLATGARVASLPGFDAPHSLVYLPDTHEVVVVANHDSRALDARTLKETRRLALPGGADSLAVDAARRRVYVVTGGKDVGQKTSALVEVDPYTGRTFGQTLFDGDHTEALALDLATRRIFINQTDKNLLDVVDAETHAILARWPVAAARQNAPIAYDERTRRLFVVTRDPGKLLVVDASSGATVQAFDAPARVDQVVWDAESRRVFVCGGDGRLAVFEQDDADRYRALPALATPRASKTCVWSPSQRRLYLAASPGETKSMAQLVWFDIAARP